MENIFSQSSRESASGGQADHAGFYLYIVPVYVAGDDGQQKLARYDAIGVPDGLPESGTQRMRASFGSLDALLSSLAPDDLRLSRAQLRAMSDGLSKGDRIDIGGFSTSGFQQIFGRQKLRLMGLKADS